MTRKLYRNGKMAILGGDVDFVNSDISAALIDLSVYTPDFESDSTIADIPEDAIISEVLVVGKMLTGSSDPEEVVFDADDVTFPSVTPSGVDVGGIVLFLDGENVEDTRLLSYDDEADGLPSETDGSDIVVAWSDDGIFGW